MKLAEESLNALLAYWTDSRNFARDCRWTQVKYRKERPDEYEYWDQRCKKFDARYKECDAQIRAIRSQLRVVGCSTDPPGINLGR